MEGYVKLHRQIINWEWYDDSNTFRLFIHLLLNANHADSNWRGKTINRGQRFTSIKHLASEVKMSDKAVRIALEKLVNTKEIVTTGASNGTMITICKYDIYQSSEEKQGRAKGQTKGKRWATNNNDNNNEENTLATWRENFEIFKSELRTEYNKLKSDKEWILERETYHPNLDILLTLKKACVDYWATEAGWAKKKLSRSKDIDWKATLNTALTLKSNQVYKQKENGKSEKADGHVY